MKKPYLGATIAALTPFLLIQACAVGEPEIFRDGEVEQSIAPTEIVEEDDCALDDFRWCEQNIDPTRDGEQSCIEDDSGTIGWTDCAPRAMNSADDCYDEETWDGQACVPASGEASTPIVLSFGGEAVRYTTGGGDFELTGEGYNVATDWPTSQTPWLALDRDGSGTIDSGAELFGSATRLASGAFARHGFEALAELDDNGDGVISSADAAYASLSVWADRNGDRVSQSAEMISLSAAGVTEISLHVNVASRCNARGNCERERAAFTYVSDGQTHSGVAIDVHLAWQ